jgi:hypothetical protein
MNKVECSECSEMVEVSGSSVVFPYVCSACLGDDTDYADEEPYNSGVPCQSALDSVQAEQFDADTEIINGLTIGIEDLKAQLSQANLNVQVQEEIIEDLENTVNAYRVIFRIPGY